MAKGVMFSPGAAARIKASVRKTEGALRTQGETQRGQILDQSGALIGKLTSALTPGGTATVDIWDLDDDLELYNTEKEVTVKDLWMASGDDDIAIGTLIGFSKLPSGKYVFTTVGCGS